MLSSSSLLLSDSFLYQMLYMYGIQIIICFILIAITIFRKEMSCNHCYSSPPPPPTITNTDDDIVNAVVVIGSSSSSHTTTNTTTTTTLNRRSKSSCKSSSSNTTTTTTTTTITTASMMMLQLLVDDDIKTDSLLEEAGCYGSGTYKIFRNTLQFCIRRIVYYYYCFNNNNNNNTNIYYYSHPLLLFVHYHIFNSITLWWNIATHEQYLDDILDGAVHNWCCVFNGPKHTNMSSSSSSSSPTTAAAAAAAVDSNIIIDRNSYNYSEYEQQDRSTTTTQQQQRRRQSEVICHTTIFPTCTASQCIPNDILIHIFSYLHPKDIISYSCSNSNIYHTLLYDDNDHNNKDDDDPNNIHHNHVMKDNDIQSSSYLNYELSHALWKTIWYRDYGWLMTHYNVGRMALQRSISLQQRQQDDDDDNQSSREDHTVVSLLLSSLEDIRFTSKFYFRFGISYVNYIVAGHCYSNTHHNSSRSDDDNNDHTDDQSLKLCLIGLGGHIYDITQFVNHHPGSSETLLVHSGCDVSCIFENMRHTISARMMAQQFCVVVDISLLSNSNDDDGGGISCVGARPTKHLLQQHQDALQGVESNILDSGVIPVLCAPVSHRCHTNRSLPSTLQYVYDTYIEEQVIYERRAKMIQSTLANRIVGDVHVYYDPMIEVWRGWYMNTNFESVFIAL